MGEGWEPSRLSLFKSTQMPISSHAVIPYIVQEFELRKPKRILDIGIGHGIYGALLRNYEEILTGGPCDIHGVEAWPDYEGPMWQCYDRIMMGDIRTLEIPFSYDMIIMADVIEHMSLKEAHICIEKLKTYLTTTGVLIISTPAIFLRQGAYKGNPYEQHRCLFGPDMFLQHQMIPVRPPKATTFGELMLIYKYKNQEVI